MTQIPTQQQWLQDTELNVFKPRSSALKAVDDAILRYQQAHSETNLWKLRDAFEDWKRSVGSGWPSNERNRKQAFTRLDRELSRTAGVRAYQASHMTTAETVALARVAEHRKRVIVTIFRDKQVTLKAARLKDQLVAAGEKVKKTCQHAAPGSTSQASLGRPLSDTVREKMTAMACSFFGVAGLEQLGSLGGLILDILGKCAVSVPPVVGQIKDGYDLFTGWAKVGADLYAQHNLAECSYSIDTGAPLFAFAALKKCLEQETRREAFSAGNATTSFALKTGLVFVDGGAVSGPVVGAVSALAEFAHTLYLLGMEYRATQAINKSLEDGDLDLRLFKTYPLMGCYLLVSATLSDLIPIEAFGTPGWMDYIENTHKNVFSQVYSAAAKLIDESPWEIIGLPKRPAGTSCVVFAEAQRMFSTLNPLSGLTPLQTLA